MISLYDLLQAGNGQLFGSPVSQIFTSITLDPIATSANQLFAAMVTPTGDTHRHIEKAIASGIAGIICSKPPECDTSGVTVIIVRDTVYSLLAWARHAAQRQTARTVAIAGSSGKATTANVIRHILKPVVSVHDNLNISIRNRLAIPLSLASVLPEHDYSLLRCAVDQPGELEQILDTLLPKIGVLTSIHHANLAAFGSIEELARDHHSLVRMTDPQGVTILNTDDDYVRGAQRSAKSRVVTLSIDNFGADFMAYNVIVGVQGTGFDLLYEGRRYLGCWVPLLGRHNLYNVLAGLAVGVEAGIPVEAALQSITTLEALPGRMRALQGLNNALVIDDSQSSNPESAVAALRWLGAIRDTRRSAVVVLGDIDSGDSTFPSTRILGETTAESASVLITHGAGATPIGRGAIDWGMESQNVHNTYNTVGALQALLGGYGLTSSDVVLIKGGEPGELAPIVDGLLKQSTPAPSAGLRTGLVRRSTAIRPTWVEIDAGAIASNVRTIRQLTGPDVTLMAVIKADGYGHGAVLTAQTALANGAEFLGVANIQEGLDLRNAGLNAPVLVMGYTPTDAVRLAIQHNLQVSLYDLEVAKAFDLAARDAGQKLKVHVKIDTGLGRLGLSPDDTKALFRHLRGMQYLEVEGIYTHFSSADTDPVHTAQQAALFKGIVLPLQAAGFGFKYVHAANTAATVTLPDFHFNMVRVGGGLYGLNPSAELALPSDFKPAMTWKALVAQVRTLPKGSSVGYGGTYITSAEERIAVLAVGYADGFRRVPTYGSVLLHNQRAPIIGRVSMEKTIVSISHIPDVATGDEAVLLGRQGSNIITADEIADRLGTISYEVTTAVLARIPRR